jgi:hypothetical protein
LVRRLMFILFKHGADVLIFAGSYSMRVCQGGGGVLGVVCEEENSPPRLFQHSVDLSC